MGASFQDVPKIPAIDYWSHPAYAPYRRTGLGQKLAALGKFSKAAARFIAIELRAAARPHSGRHQILRRMPELARNGIIARRIPTDLKCRLNEVISGELESLLNRLSGKPAAERSYEDAQKVLRGEAYRPIYETVAEILAGEGLFADRRPEIALRHVKTVTLQVNDEGETHWREKFADVQLPDSPVNYLHVDTGAGVIKAIIYISEVEEGNGEFSYVIGSNRTISSPIDRVIRSSNDYSKLSASDPEARRLFAALPSFLRRKADFGKDVLRVDPAWEAILKRERRFTSADGDLIVFDNFGMHRGGMVRKGRRIILQVILW